MVTYDVYRTENRAEGRTDHLGTVEAETAEAALAEAQAREECRPTQRLWVRPAHPSDYDDSVSVAVDCENSADRWWCELDAASPDLAARLRGSGPGQQVGVTIPELRLCQSLPGWDGGPRHAPHPLITY